MVKIKLPEASEGMEVKHFLKQLELSVHHAQKAYEEMVKDDLVNEETFIYYRFPNLNLNDREQDDNGFAKVHVDEESELEIELEITN